MSEYKLKTAVLGLNDPGQLLLTAASRTGCFEIQAVADKDTHLAEKLAEEYKCNFYDDYRQLIIQNQFDCLLVAAGLHSCDEHLRTAIKKKFNILKLPPPARNFEEAAEFVQLAEAENIKFAVANPARFDQNFLALHDSLQQGSPPAASGAFLITTFYNAGEQNYPAWYTDPELAGGGVLLHNCYHLIDQILWNFPTPQQVYSLNTNQASDKKQRLYMTEDTALITMKFSDTLTGSFIASRRMDCGPKQEILKIYGRDKFLTISDSQLIVSDASGQINKKFQTDDNALNCTMKLLENFAFSILSPDTNKLCSTGKENLKNMAVLESAYLSARTGFPEEPGRILQMAPHQAGTPANT